MRLIAYPKPVPFIGFLFMSAVGLGVSVDSYQKGDTTVFVLMLIYSLVFIAGLVGYARVIVVKQRKLTIYYMVPFLKRTIEIAEIKRLRIDEYDRHVRFGLDYCYVLETTNGKSFKWRTNYIENWERLELAIRWLQVNGMQSLDDMYVNPLNFQRTRYRKKDRARLQTKLILSFIALPLLLYINLAVIVDHSNSPDFRIVGGVLFALLNSYFVYWIMRWRRKKVEVESKLRSQGSEKDGQL